MSDIASERGDAGAGIDLRQFHQIFFEEAWENLEHLEQQLLEIDLEVAADETLNSIFRCAHSVKGGAATFGFDDVAELTHQMESLLDKLRRRELEPTAAMVNVLLQSGDALKAQLTRHQSGSTADPIDTTELLGRFRGLLSGGAPAPATVLDPVSTPTPAAHATDPVQPAANRELELRLGGPGGPPVDARLIGLVGDGIAPGTLEALDRGVPIDGVRRFKLVTSFDDDDLIDMLTFHVARDHVALLPYRETEPDPQPPSAAAMPEQSAAAKPESRPPPPSVAEASTLRVSVEKVDQLINLVGELVITQAMLAQTGGVAETALHQQLAAGLADLERNTRDLQESVMSIRMIPMSAVFNRFPRMVRDLAGRLDKKVTLVTQGEATEVDKGMIEKITDPLTHLVRNSCDHGIEPPTVRREKGKPEAGTITLSASHQGGNIVIEVRDDGKGLNREGLIGKAREKGIPAPDSLQDGEVWELIFAPGFSTAEDVTDVSGRGVGMDVVKRNIAALGGRVEIESVEGVGMTVKVRLPLTLAIMDSMSVGVGTECYILPLASVVESFQFSPDKVKTIGGGAQVVQVREEFLPVIELERVFDVPRTGRAPERPIMVVVEADGRRLALLVDELLGQQQVVVKNLESNYGKVDNVSGATIAGDGRVALILDVGSLVRRARH